MRTRTVGVLVFLIGIICMVIMHPSSKKGSNNDAFQAADDLLKKQSVIGRDVLLAVQRTNGTIEVIKLRDGVYAPKGYTVTFPRLNGVGTQYEVTSPKGCKTLRMKRNMRVDGVTKQVTYTPYTKGIDTPELRRQGLEYLAGKLDRATADLKEKRIGSRAYEGLVADAIPKDVSLTLAVIEHIDPARFNAGISIEQLIGEVLIVLAANRENAYRYSISKAGARGQFQFMRGTYARITKSYPKAGLIEDFAAGMDNHVNAATASILLFDADLGCLTKNHRKFLKEHPEAMGKYLAAAYNGGPGRALNAIHRYTWEWESHVLPETCTYLKEFSVVWKYLYT